MGTRRGSSIALALLLATAVLVSRAHAQEDCNVEDLSAPCALADGMIVQDTIREQGGRHYFWFGVPVANSRLHVELVDLPADYDLYLFSDQSPDPTRPIAQSANTEVTSEVIDEVLADQGTYLLEVISDPGQPFDPDQPYTLLFGLAQPPPPTPTPEPTPEPTPTPEPARATVPPVVHRGRGTAEAEMLTAGLVPLVHVVDRFSLAGAGTVASQEPPAGAVVSPGTPVDIFVATGNVEVPHVEGLTEQAAFDVLHAAGLKVETRRAATGSIPAGMALGSPSAGQVLPSGSTVELIISRGQ